MYEIGEKIRYYREKINMSQKDFAEKIGISTNRASNWERGENRPSVDFLIKICEVLQVGADELLDINVSNGGKLYKLNGEEEEVLNSLREFDGKNKIRLLGYIEALKEK